MSAKRRPDSAVRHRPLINVARGVSPRKVWHYHVGDNVVSPAEVALVSQNEEAFIEIWDRTHPDGNGPQVIVCYDDGTHRVLRPYAEPLFTLRDHASALIENVPTRHPFIMNFIPAENVDIKTLPVGQVIYGKCGTDNMSLERTI